MLKGKNIFLAAAVVILLFTALLWGTSGMKVATAENEGPERIIRVLRNTPGMRKTPRQRLPGFFAQIISFFFIKNSVILSLPVFILFGTICNLIVRSVELWLLIYGDGFCK